MKVKQGSESFSPCHSQKVLETRNVCMHSCPAKLPLTNPLKWAQMLPESPPWSPICTIAAPFLSKEKKTEHPQWAFLSFISSPWSKLHRMLVPKSEPTQTHADLIPHPWRIWWDCCSSKSFPRFDKTFAETSPFSWQTFNHRWLKTQWERHELIQRLVKENSCKWALIWHFRFVWIL